MPSTAAARTTTTRTAAISSREARGLERARRAHCEVAKVTAAVLTGKPPSATAATCCWPVTPAAEAATYLAYLHDRRSEQAAAEEAQEQDTAAAPPPPPAPTDGGAGVAAAAAGGGEGAGGRKRQREQLSPTRTADPSHLATLLRHELARERELMAADDARAKRFKARLGFTQATYARGIGDATRCAACRTYSAELNRMLKATVKATVHGLRGVAPPQGKGEEEGSAGVAAAAGAGAAGKGKGGKKTG